MKDTKDFGMFTAMGRSLADPSDIEVDPIVDIPQDSTDDDLDDIKDPSEINDDSTDDTQATDDSTTDDIDDSGSSDDTDDQTDITDDTDDVSINSNPSSDVVDSDTSDDYNEEELAAFEGEWIGTIQDKLYEKFDFQYDDDEEKIKSVDGMADYINKLIDENSRPSYANEEIEKLNQYVSDGGDLSQYFNSRYKDGVDLDKLDLDNPSDQRLIVKEYFELQGAPSSKINKKIETYDETGILEDEAIDALEYLKTNREKESQKLLLEQEKINQATKEQQQKFFDDVTSNIKSKKEIMGGALTPKRKNELIEAIFKTDKNGLTRFQKEYQSDPIEATILSAYAALYKDELIKNINKKASSDAARNIKKKFDISKQKRMKSSGSSYSGDDGVASFTSLSRMMTKPS